MINLFNFKSIKNLDKTFEIFDLISKKRKSQFFSISIIAVFAALFESISIGLLIPIVSLLTNQVNKDQAGLKYIDFIESINFTSIDTSKLIFYCFILVILLGSFVKVLYLYLQASYGSKVVQEFNITILRNSILQPYQDYIGKDSSTYISAILSKSSFINRYLSNLLIFLVTVLSFIAIISALILINFKLTFFIFLFVFIFYWLLSSLIKKRVKAISRYSSELYTSELNILNELHGYQKEILLSNFFKRFLKRFTKIDKRLRDKVAEASYLSASPRYILESLVLIFAIIAIFISVEKNNFNLNFIPLLAAFLLGIQKLLPIVQTFYATWINHRTCENGILEIISLTKEYKDYSTSYLKAQENLKLFSNFKNIIFSDVSFAYNPNQKNIIKNLNLNIRRGEFIGIFGDSGEGKSTLLNIISGLNKPSKGFLLVDKSDVFYNFENLKSWRSQIAYVSQNIYLSPNSIIYNITMGESEEEINYERFKYAIKVAQLGKFIKSLKNGYLTSVGEQGVQISGGQKQRIALARAIYKNTKLLILDEATSALDKKNEMNIISAMKKIINEKRTIIAVSHKLEILKDCERLFQLSKGVLKEIDFEILNKK